MFSIPDAANALAGGQILHISSPENASGICIDTRKLKAGNLFCALAGQNVNGHDYLDAAFKGGAAGALIERSYAETHSESLKGYKNLIVVDSPEKALLELAAWHRLKFKIPFWGITGSVGKTSTKEFLRYLLGCLFQTDEILANTGNFNNHLGLPLTLMNLTDHHRVCVAELGASAPGEIGHLSRVLQPGGAILTCVAPCHLGGFGSLEHIYQTKLDLFRALPEGASAVMPDDDKELDQKISSMKLNFRRVGFSDSANCRLSDVKMSKGWVSFKYRDQWIFEFPSDAEFLVRNAGMALALLEAEGFDPARLPRRWKGFSLPDGRFAVRHKGGRRVIFDGYNASPLSFKAALHSFVKLKDTSRRSLLVFSDMLDLGGKAEDFHRDLAHEIRRAEPDVVIGYGEWADVVFDELKACPNMTLKRAADPHEAGSFLASLSAEGDLILLKASRGMQIEKALHAFENLEQN